MPVKKAQQWQQALGLLAAMRSVERLDATMAACIQQREQMKHLLDLKRVVIVYEPVWAIETGRLQPTSRHRKRMRRSASGFLKQCI